MKSKLIFGIIFGILIISSFIIALQITTFNNNLTEENLTFTGNENITRYLNVSRYANFTSAIMNMSGYLYNTSYNLEVFNTTASYSGGWIFINNAFDGNWSTYSQLQPGNNGDIIQNFTVTTSSYESLEWKVHFFPDGGVADLDGVLHSCFNSSGNWQLLFYYLGANVSLDQNWTIAVPSECVLNENIVSINTSRTNGGLGVTPKFYESQLQWTYNTTNYTVNGTLDIGTYDLNKEWESNILIYNDTEEDSAVTCVNFVDEDWDTYCSILSIDYVNYTLPTTKDKIKNITIQIKVGESGGIYSDLDIYFQNWTNGSAVLLEGYLPIVEDYDIPADSNVTLNFSINTTEQIQQVLEDGKPLKILYNINNITSLIYAFEESVFFEISGENYTRLNHTTNDFSTSINTALNGGECDCVGCSLVNGNCSVPFIFHSDTGGILEYSSLDFQFNEIIIPNFTINSPPNSSVDLTSTLNVTILNSSILDYCYYNITRGAATEIANTNLSCINFTDSITVSSYSTTYNINLFANYTDGFENTTTYSFITKADPALGGGGGGTGDTGGGIVTSTIIIGMTNETSWSMTTQDGSSKYTFKMSDGTARERLVLFENLGTSDRTITLSCEPINDSKDLCQYLVISDEEFTLPAAKNTTTSVEMELIIPENLPKDTYLFNIVGTDDLNQRGIVTIEVDNDLSFISDTLVKLISSKNINGIKIPYMIFFIFGVALLAVGVFYAGFKKSKGGAAISFIIGVFGSFLLIFFL